MKQKKIPQPNTQQQNEIRRKKTHSDTYTIQNIITHYDVTNIQNKNKKQCEDRKKKHNTNKNNPNKKKLNKNNIQHEKTQYEKGKPKKNKYNATFEKCSTFGKRKYKRN